MMRRAAILTAAAWLPVVALTQPAPIVTQELGPAGEIAHWLMLGYIPLAIEQQAFDKDLTLPASVLNADLLAPAGGEDKIAPVAGQTVKLAASATVKVPVELAWQLVRTSPAKVKLYWTSTQRLSLFNLGAGRFQDKAACYLYCRLLSPTDLRARLLTGSDDAVRIMLNGKVVHRFVGQRALLEDEEDIALELHKGANDLLVRVDNYGGFGGFCGRLVDANGLPLQILKTQLSVPAGARELPMDEPDIEPWAQIKALIPPLGPVEHQEFFGAHLSRTLSLLENGAQTHRPVKIIVYGQSIEWSDWPNMLIKALRERYPNTEIVAVNAAVGAWNVGALLRLMNHSIIREKPDVVLFHAYQGTPEEWDRLLQTIRRETCAEIMIRTAHIAEYDSKNMDARVTAETTMLRELAQKYDIELVDVHREWIDYLLANKLDYSVLLRDAIHLNNKGSSLMAQLYERHFRVNMLGRGNWMNTVRSFNVLRCLEDRQVDEVVLSGGGWTDIRYGARATGPGNSLKLKFTGKRVDLILLPDNGSAKVLIDGKSPSQFNLFHGEPPVPRNHHVTLPATAMRYHGGPNRVGETWELTFKDITPGKFRFSLRGSTTGEDGQGSSDKLFVSKSGRVTISPFDWRYTPDYKPPVSGDAPVMLMQIVPDYRDRVSCVPADSTHAPEDIPYQYVTVADGLPPGEHELTLIPSATGSFSIQAVEAYNPPLGHK